jgi:cation-transporting ATPase 13A1
MILTFLSFDSGYWNLRMNIFLHYQPCDLKDATHVYACSTKSPNHLYLERIEHGCFYFRKRKYMIDINDGSISKVKYPYQLSATLCKYFREEPGIESNKIDEYRKIFGRNEYNIPIPTFAELFIKQALAPFFLFQVFCVLLWSMDDYFMYSLMTLALLFTFECTLTQSRLRNLRTIRQMANPETSLSKEEKEIFSYDRRKVISRTDLLPNEIVRVGEGSVPADMVLIDGEVVVNESLLTGESTPLLKSSLFSKYTPKSTIDKKDLRPHIIFAGTKILQSRSTQKHAKEGAIAKVIRTGFGTSQGKLVRTILESSTSSYTDWQSYGFILFLVQFALLASCYVFYHLWDSGIVSNYKVILNCILIVTSVVPPELPMELSLAINSSLVALHKKYIFCTEPNLIAVAGHVHTCCFDKTGTLTDSDMKMVALRHMNEAHVDFKRAHEVLQYCNTLVEIGGEWVGDGMERAARKWLEANYYLSKNAKLIKRWDFESRLRRMSVLVSRENRAYIYVKGAPETLKERFTNLENKEKYDKMVFDFANAGFRVLALGYKQVPSKEQSEKWERDEAECDLEFVGLALFGSELKRNTKETIFELRQADMRCVMITGDNILTACHVAKQCGISDAESKQWILRAEGPKLEWFNHVTHETLEFNPSMFPDGDLCVSGDLLLELQSIYNISLSVLCNKVTIYARVAPNQKENILNAMKQYGDITLMCGDGTNDVGALKAAHIGVALISSEESPQVQNKETPIQHNKKPKNIAEFLQQTQQQLDNEVDESNVRTVKLGDASIAAPFTSRLGNIGSIREILKQGRCTLVTTYQMYKILAINCLLTAYSLSVLYLMGVKFTDAQMLGTGLCIAAFFLFISRSTPSERLSAERPEKNVWNGRVIGSVMAQFMVHLTVLICCVGISKNTSPLDALRLQSRFHIEEENDEHVKKSLMNTIVFLVSSFQTVITFANNYRGEPFMQNFWRNKPLFISFCMCTLVLTSFLMDWEITADLHDYLGLVNLSEYGIQTVLSLLIVADAIGVVLIERLCRLVF